MKKNLYFICFILCFMFLIMGYSFYKDNTILFLVLIAFLLISIVLFFKENRIMYTPEKLYQKKLLKIKRVYDAILVKMSKLLSLEHVYPLLVEDFDELLKIQEEITGMILYYEEDNACTFTLLDDKTLYYYVLTENDEVEPLIFDKIDEQERRMESSLENILEDLDKTMIFKLEKGKTLKISPIRSKTSSVSNINQEESVEKISATLENKVDLPKLKETV